MGLVMLPRVVARPRIDPGLLAAGLLSFSLALDFFLALDDSVVSNVTAGETVRLLCLAGAF